MRLQTALSLTIFLAAILPAQTGKPKTGKLPVEKTARGKSKDGRPERRREMEKRLLEMRDAMRKGQIRHYNVHVRVHLKNNNKLHGVVRDGRFVEVHNGLDFVAADRRQRAAGLRVWYTSGTNSFIFVPYSDIAFYKIGRILSDDQVKMIEQEVAAKREAVKGKDRRIVAAKKTVEPSRPTKENPAVRDPGLPVLTPEQAAMLAEFPVAQGWGESKIASLKLRRVTVGVYPNAKEKKFEDIYADWAKALAAQEKLEAARLAVQQAGGAGATGSQGVTPPSGTELRVKPPAASGPPMPGTRK